MWTLRYARCEVSTLLLLFVHFPKSLLLSFTSVPVFCTETHRRFLKAFLLLSDRIWKFVPLGPKLVTIFMTSWEEIKICYLNYLSIYYTDKYILFCLSCLASLTELKGALLEKQGCPLQETPNQEVHQEVMKQALHTVSKFPDNLVFFCGIKVINTESSPVLSILWRIWW